MTLFAKVKFISERIEAEKLSFVFFLARPQRHQFLWQVGGQIESRLVFQRAKNSREFDTAISFPCCHVLICRPPDFIRDVKHLDKFLSANAGIGAKVAIVFDEWLSSPEITRKCVEWADDNKVEIIDADFVKRFRKC